MSVSPLSQQLIAAHSGNYTQGRHNYAKISEITVHHTAGALSVEQLGALWQNPARKGSSNYGINGKNIACYVSEGDVAWTNSNWQANCRAVTIEVCNSAGAPQWPVSDESLESTIQLVADIAKRCGLGTLVVGKNLTMHSQYIATACPGPYLQERMQHIADSANAINSTPPPQNGGTTDDSQGSVAQLKEELEHLMAENSRLELENKTAEQTIISHAAELEKTQLYKQKLQTIHEESNI